jgi:hypothetical protein
VSRHPVETPPALEQRLTIVGALLLASLSCALSFVGGIFFAPWALGRLVVAIRAAHVTSVGSAPRTMSAGVALLAIIGTPALAVVIARAGAIGHILSAHVIGPVVAGFALVPLFLRLPLVLALDRVAGREISLLEATSRAITHAVAAPLDTIRFTVALVGVVTLVVGVGRGLASGAGELVAVIATLALMPVAIAAVLYFLSAATPAEPPRLRAWMLWVLALFVALPSLGVLQAGGLATSEPRAATVVTEGRGLQLERGMMTERGPRGAFLDHRFAVEGRPGGVRLVRSDGHETWIETRYDASAAWMTREPCRDWHARFASECDVIRMRGTDWEMQLLLDAGGVRLDDGAVDRAFERVGVLGAIAFLAAPAVLVLVALAIVRVRRAARRLAARDRRHHLRGRLQLGEGGAIEGDTIVGDHNRVVLDEGARVLRLPTKQGILAIEAALVATLSEGRVLPVQLALDTLPSVDAHRAADAPLPADAAIVVGDPAAIESDALVTASRGLSRLVLVAMLLGAASGLALAAS